MEPKGYTLRDETLAHQVVMYVESGKSDVHVSCNCARTETGGHRSFGISENIAESRELYNDWSNHGFTFGKEDLAKW